uniref:Splicing regulatory glutamine/lysine-rich protein 1 n=1 Tax=Hippocampus comes TaxID=109280 RepID=A0A3Q2Y8J7_HIPCM
VHSLLPGRGLLPIPTPTPLQNLSLPLVGHVTTPLDPAAASLPQPPLMGNVDPTKVDEIRRTVYVGNLNSQTTTAEQLLDFFQQVGDVKFVRMAGDETQPSRFAFVEFVEQDAVARALTFNGVMFGDRPLKVNHSNNAIVKPPEMTPQAAAKQLESVMKRVREAQSTIAAAIEPGMTAAHVPNHRRCRGNRFWPRNNARASRSGHGRRSRSRDRRRSRSHSRWVRNARAVLWKEHIFDQNMQLTGSAGGVGGTRGALPEGPGRPLQRGDFQAVEYEKIQPKLNVHRLVLTWVFSGLKSDASAAEKHGNALHRGRGAVRTRSGREARKRTR